MYLFYFIFILFFYFNLFILFLFCLFIMCCFCWLRASLTTPAPPRPRLRGAARLYPNPRPVGGRPLLPAALRPGGHAEAHPGAGARLLPHHPPLRPGPPDDRRLLQGWPMG